MTDLPSKKKSIVREARFELLHRLSDWRDAGASVECVADAIEGLIAAKLQESNAAETSVPQEPQPIPVTEIVAALEREAANTDTDSRWLAAVAMRRLLGWEGRTLMCRIDQRPSLVESQVKTSAEGQS